MDFVNSHQSGQSIDSSKLAASNVFDRLNKGSSSSEGGEQFSSLFDKVSSKFISSMGNLKQAKDSQSMSELSNQTSLSAQKRSEENKSLKQEEEEEKENKRKILAKKAQELKEQEQLDDLAQFNQAQAFSTFNLEQVAFATQGQSGDAVAEQGFCQFSSGGASNFGSATQDQAGTLNLDPADPKQKASNLMAQLSDDSLDIKDDLNKISRHQLSNIDSEAQDESETIKQLNNQDLRSSLDKLARENNVSKLSLQMQNPQTQAQALKDAQALADLPTSKDNLSGLSPSASGQEQLLDKLNQGAQDATQKANELSKISTNEFLTKRQNRLNAQNALSNNTTTTNGASVKANSAQSALLQMASDPESVNMSQDALREFSARNDLIEDQAINPNKAQSLSEAISSLQSSAKSGVNNTNSKSLYNFQESQVDDGESILAISKDNGGLLEGEPTSALSSGFDANTSSSFDGSSGSAFLAQGMSTSTSTLNVRAHNSNQMNFMNMHSDPQANANEIHEKVMAMSARNLKHLTVELSPNDLGKMKISIDLSKDNDALSVSLAAANPSTREALAAALPKLQDILMQQNIQTDAQIYDLNDDQSGNSQDGQLAQDNSSEQGQGQDQEKEQQALMQSIYGDPNVGTVLAKSEENGVIADNLTDKQARQAVGKSSTADSNITKTGLNLFA